MKITLMGYLAAKKYTWSDEITFTWTGYDPTTVDPDCVIVRPESLTFDVPDNFDIRPVRIEALKKQRENKAIEYAETLARIDDEIKSLLAIGSE